MATSPARTNYNLDFLTAQVRQAADVDNPDIPDLSKFERAKLMKLISRSASSLPRSYRTAVGLPLQSWLESSSSDAKLFWKFYQDPERADPATKDLVGAIGDIIQAVLQHGLLAPSLHDATNAFQEVVSDLYDGFLSGEDRGDIKPPDYAKLPALVKWGNKEFGPYTLVPDFLNQLGIEAAIVSMPPGFAQNGIASYTTLGHETTGHDILHADAGLLDEIGNTIRSEISPGWLGNYWYSVTDEAASDVIGVLNFGPAAGIGFLAFFRGWGGRLRNSAPLGDVHPIDILRGFLQVEVLDLLPADSKVWRDFILAEVNKDLRAAGGKLVFPGGRTVAYDHTNPVSADAKAVQQSIKSFAKLVASAKLVSLEQHSLDEIQTWTNEDDQIVADLRKQLRGGEFAVNEGYYAAHAVSAATLEGLENGDDQLFGRMIKLLDAMHDKNPTFSPPRFFHRAYLP